MDAPPHKAPASASARSAAWAEATCWWHVYPLGAVGAPIRPERPVAEITPRLRRLIPWLDHVRELGLDGLLLGPVFASMSHGYDTVDPLRIDPRLGAEEDLVALISAAHERGIRVVLDGVFNHIGREHPLVQQAHREGPDSDAASMLRLTSQDWGPEDPLPVEVFEGHGDLVALDHSSPLVAQLVIDVMRHWLDRGADGWRLDAAYAVPAEFWAPVLGAVRESHPHAWFTGEVIHGDKAALVAASTMDSVTQYELWQGIWHGIADANLYELAHAISRHDELLETVVPSTFLGNHDVTRIASSVGEEHLPHALAVLLTVGGTPSVYAGDEYGLRAIKEERPGGDDAVRPALPPQVPRGAQLTGAQAHVEALTRRLLEIRRSIDGIPRGRTLADHVDNRSLVLRTEADGGPLVAALSLEDHEVRLPTQRRDLAVLAGSAAVQEDGESTWISLPPRGWAVLGRRPAPWPASPAV